MSTVTVQTISNGTVSTSSANVIQGSARAWANLNGTGGSVRNSFNVSSMTKNGAGDYTVNFTNAMPNANFATVSNFSYIASAGDASYNVPIAPWLQQQTTTSVRIGGINYGSGSNIDSLVVGVAIFSS
jgi:hypothetical protein